MPENTPLTEPRYRKYRGGWKQKRKPTQKQKKLAQSIARQMANPFEKLNLAKAAMDAGYASRKEAQEALQNSRTLQASLQEMLLTLEGQGVNAPYVARKIKEGLEAETVKVATNDGKITDQKTFPDYAVRERYIEKLLRLMQLVDARGIAPDGAGGVGGGPQEEEAGEKKELHIHFHDMSPQKLQEYINSKLAR